MDKETFILENFRELRKEINLRISTHTQLVTAKVFSIGAVIAFLIKDAAGSEIAKLGFLALPPLCFLFDVMIAKNIGNIHKIGIFIREKIEKEAYDIVMWERQTGQRSIGVRCYGILDIVFLSLTTLVTSAISIGLIHMDFPILAVSLGVLFLLLMVFVIYYMTKTILYFESKGNP